MAGGGWGVGVVVPTTYSSPLQVDKSHSASGLSWQLVVSQPACVFVMNQPQRTSAATAKKQRFRELREEARRKLPARTRALDVVVVVGMMMMRE